MKAIRPIYDAIGAEQFYREQGRTYSNPHASIIAAIVARVIDDEPLDLSRVLDLAAGAGEASLPLLAAGAAVEAFDPFTAEAYQRAVGRPCEPVSFEDIAAGMLRERRWSLVVCSFALHLAERSRLAAIALELARRSPALLVLTPHKRPVLREAWGWSLRREWLHERVRARLYDSTLDR